MEFGGLGLLEHLGKGLLSRVAKSRDDRQEKLTGCFNA